MKRPGQNNQYLITNQNNYFVMLSSIGLLKQIVTDE